MQIATKCGFDFAADGTLSVRGDPAHVRACCEGSLKRLGVDCIDLYYQHRVDPKVPIEETVRDVSAFVKDERSIAGLRLNWGIGRWGR